MVMALFTWQLWSFLLTYLNALSLFLLPLFLRYDDEPLCIVEGGGERWGYLNGCLGNEELCKHFGVFFFVSIYVQ